MGQGCHLTLINDSQYDWVRTHVKSYQMNHWNDAFPQSIPGHTSITVYIEYDEGIRKKLSHCGGEITYDIIPGEVNFQITLLGDPRCFVVKYKGELTPPAPWLKSNGDRSEELVSWPPFLTERARLPFIHNGNPSLWIGEVNNANAGEWATLIDTSRYNPLIDAGLDVAFAADSFVRSAWMGHMASAINRLTISELLLPGTHDSSCWAMAADLINRWARTQHHTFAEQLSHGIRSLDIRVGHKVIDGAPNYYLVHDKFIAKPPLSELFSTVNAFIDAFPSEIVVLDFHRFVALDGNHFNLDGLYQLCKEHLGHRYIPRADQNKSIGEVWKGNGRVVIAMNTAKVEPADQQYFWPGVRHWWAEKSKDKSSVVDFMRHNLSQPHHPHHLSAMGVVLPATMTKKPALFRGHISREVLHPIREECADILRHGNICAVDWANETGVVNACVIASIRKGLGLHPR